MSSRRRSLRRPRGPGVLLPRRRAVIAGRESDPGATSVVLDEPQQLFTARPTARPDVARPDLALLDVHVRVERETEQLVRGVAGHVAVRPEVVRQTDLMHYASLHRQRDDALGDENPGLD